MRRPRGNAYGVRSFSFGGPDDESEAEAEAWRRRSSPPENELPKAVAVDAVLGRGPDAVVAVSVVQAYTTGLSFEVAVRLRTSPRGLLRHGLHALMDGGWDDEEVDLDQRLLLGVEYADGRVATNLDMFGWPGWLGGPAEAEPGLAGDRRDTPGDGPLLLTTSGGGGGDRTYDHVFWLSPLPPPGPLAFVCAWSGFGIAETRTVVDGAAISAAGSRAEELWPWEPEPETELAVRPPRLPATGWFGEVARRRGGR